MAAGAAWSEDTHLPSSPEKGAPHAQYGYKMSTFHAWYGHETSTPHAPTKKPRGRHTSRTCQAATRRAVLQQTSRSRAVYGFQGPLDELPFEPSPPGFRRCGMWFRST
eukprot:718511-Pelagomonas_calceolata.AAC.4